jgi:hypothetical protein
VERALATSRQHPIRDSRFTTKQTRKKIKLNSTQYTVTENKIEKSTSDYSILLLSPPQHHNIRQHQVFGVLFVSRILQRQPCVVDFYRNYVVVKLVRPKRSLLVPLRTLAVADTEPSLNFSLILRVVFNLSYNFTIFITNHL